jgi:cytochrome c oxidase subunit 4
MSDSAHGHDPQMSHGAHGHDPQAAVRTYLTIFAALAFLTLLTVGVAYMHLPGASGIIIALLIAMAKIFLIGSFFMHLRHEGKLINISLAVCLGLVLILIVFVLPDLGIHELEELHKKEAMERNPYVLQHEAHQAGAGDAGGGH